MELTLENLIDEIVNQEQMCYLNMLDAKSTYKEESSDFIFKYWNAKWSVLYNLARKFGFADKLKR